MENLNTEKLNPWISIWTKPRATIQQIVEADPTRLVLLLAAVGGVSQFLDRASLKNFGDLFQVWQIVAMALVGGSIGGVIGLYISSFLIAWTGKRIGGVGNVQNIKAAIAWSNVPLVFSLVLWIPQLLLFGNELFTKDTPVTADSVTLSLLMMGFGIVEATIGIWTFVVFLKCLGQVQGFSAWKALGNVFMVFVVVFVPILAIGMLFVFLLPIMIH